MKRFVDSLLILFITVIIIAFAATSGQAEARKDGQTHPEENMPQYTGTRLIQASLDLIGGRAYCGSTLEVYPGYIGYLTMYLQKKTSGSWSNVTSWSGNTSNSYDVSLDEVYGKLTVGTTYRVRAVGMVYQNEVFVEQVPQYLLNKQDNCPCIKWYSLLHSYGMCCLLQPAQSFAKKG